MSNNNATIDAIKETPITKLTELSQFQEPKWIFRGEKYYAQPLRSSLELFIERANGYGRFSIKNDEIERNLLREFKRRYHHYSYTEPEDDLNLEWLALMRHHGAPTRLLDFTYSIYVAAYFALEDAGEGKDGLIWGIKREWCDPTACDIINKQGKGLKGEWVKKPLSNKEDEKAFCSIFLRNDPFKVVAAMNPFSLSQRITTQLGVFMCPGDVNVTFVKNLTALDGWDQSGNILKIRIPQASRINILKDLFDMNINRASLFPGLDGFASSLGVYHPVIFRDLVPA